jgi:hypothetical protein
LQLCLTSLVRIQFKALRLLIEGFGYPWIEWLTPNMTCIFGFVAAGVSWSPMVGLGFCTNVGTQSLWWRTISKLQETFQQKLSKTWDLDEEQAKKPVHKNQWKLSNNSSCNNSQKPSFSTAPTWLLAVPMLLAKQPGSSSSAHQQLPRKAK